MPFDVQAARAAGYSDAEIADEMAKDSAFDTAGARSAGYSDAEIIAELGAAPVSAQAPDVPAQQPVDSPERRALVAELGRRTASADAAGRRLSSLETVEKFARPVLSGLTNIADAQPIVAIPRLLANAGIQGVNLAAGTNVPTIDEITPPSLRPRNDAEALSASVLRGVAGAAGGVGVGQQLATSGAGLGSSYLGGLGTSLAANPVLQTVGGASGGVASEVARREGAGPLVQTLAGVAGGLAPSAALGAAGKLATGVTRTPEAQRLLNRGVDLTPGQLNSKGLQNQVEESLQSVGGVGPPIAAARQNARETFQRVAVQEGAAPGTQVTQADPAAMLQQAYDSFTPLYDAAKGFPASAQIVNATGPNVPLSTALSRAVRNRGILATNEQRKTVLSYLKDQLTKGVRSSDDLLDIRSSIRDKQRAAANAQGKEEQAELLAAADDVITQALDSQLPPDALSKLRTADAKYGDYKTVERAVARAKDRGGRGDFTPNDLSEAIAQASRGSNAGRYARGGGGALREIAADGRAVLDARSPTTGARLLTIAGPAAGLGAIDPATGAAVVGTGVLGSLAAATTQTGRRLAAGTTSPQQAILRQLQQRGLTNVPVNVRNALVGGAVNYGAQNLTPTAQIVRDMIGIPQSAPPSPFIGLDQQQEEALRAGLYQ